MFFFWYFFVVNELDVCLKWVVEVGEFYVVLSFVIGLLWGFKFCDIISGVRGNDFVIFI